MPINSIKLRKIFIQEKLNFISYEKHSISNQIIVRNFSFINLITQMNRKLLDTFFYYSYLVFLILLSTSYLSTYNVKSKHIYFNNFFQTKKNYFLYAICYNFNPQDKKEIFEWENNVLLSI